MSNLHLKSTAFVISSAIVKEAAIKELARQVEIAKVNFDEFIQSEFEQNFAKVEARNVKQKKRRKFWAFLPNVLLDKWLTEEIAYTYDEIRQYKLDNYKVWRGVFFPNEIRGVLRLMYYIEPPHKSWPRIYHFSTIKIDDISIDGQPPVCYLSLEDMALLNLTE